MQPAAFAAVMMSSASGRLSYLVIAPPASDEGLLVLPVLVDHLSDALDHLVPVFTFRHFVGLHGLPDGVL